VELVSATGMNPVMACDQQGSLPAVPPITSEQIQIHVCTRFSGGTIVQGVGQNWCEQASRGPATFPMVRLAATSIPDAARGSVARWQRRTIGLSDAEALHRVRSLPCTIAETNTAGVRWRYKRNWWPRQQLC